MKVSVIIPAFNEEKYIDACLSSLMKQTEAPDEIIVVDNNSTDRTVEIAAQFPVIILPEKKQGMIPARNAGFMAAKGDILARCDSDAVLPSDWIERIKKDFQDNRIDGLSGPTFSYDLPLFLKSPLFMKQYLKDMKRKFKGNNILMGPNMIITRKAWELVKDEVCLDDTKVHEDIDLSIHMMKKGLKIMCDMELVVGTSARRVIKNPQSFFIEYPKRMANTLREHLI